LTFKRFAKYQFPLLGWILLIFGLSAIPNVPTVKFIIAPDKIAHTGIYFLLCLFGWRAFFHQEKYAWLRRNALLAALLFTILYGVLDEIHQIYVPGRTPDVFDALADAFGGTVFVLWIWARGRLKKRKIV
jgi:VanZ family protein